MAEYIEREALMRRIKEIHCAECDSYHGVRCRACWVDDTLDYIDSEPAADVAPVVHGRWEGYTHSRYCGIDEYGEPIYRDGIVYYCSNPKCRRKTVIKENYCPACGAKMDMDE